MGSDWSEASLDEIFEFSSGLSKPRSEFGFGHGFLTFKDVFDNYFVPDQLTALVNSTASDQQACSIKRGDVFLTRTSETIDDLGMSCLALKDYESATFNGFTKRLRPRVPTTVVPEYAGYFFRSARFRREVTAMSSLSTRASLNNDMLSRLTIVMPPIEIQRAIGRILKSLDDKIELNRRMSATLEGLVRGLFKSWFVDFDPVTAKAAGRQPAHMSAATAALFPNRFIDSPVGPIPAGWTVASVPESFDVNPTRRLLRGVLAPYLDMQSMPTVSAVPDSWVERECGSGMRFTNGDTLVARITPCLENGKTAYVNFLDEAQVGWGSTEYIVLRSKPPLPLSFSYFLARDDDFRAFAISNMTGSSGRQRVPANCLSKYLVVIPTKEVAAAFGKVATQSLDKVLQNSVESKSLSEMRDALLPQLLSGEIRLRDAEKLVEEVA